MVLGPLQQPIHVLDGHECRVGVGGDKMSVWVVLGTKDPPVLEVKVKPRDHFERQEGKDAKFKKLLRLLLVELGKTTVSWANDNVVSLVALPPVISPLGFVGVGQSLRVEWVESIIRKSIYDARFLRIEDSLLLHSLP